MRPSGMIHAAGLAAFCILCAGHACATTVLVGHVTNAATQAPMAGVEVQIADSGFPPHLYAQLETSSDGAFAWTGTCEPATPGAGCYVQAYSTGFYGGTYTFEPSDT